MGVLGMDVLLSCAALIQKSQKILVLTGAGMSTESGIPDFRSETGLYALNYRGLPPEMILSLSFFEKNPRVFWQYIADCMDYANVQPNTGHRILAKWEKQKDITIVTQNIDALHTLAGSERVIEIHGCIKTATCRDCRKKYRQADVLAREDGYICSCGGIIKPDIVLYEENVKKIGQVLPLVQQVELLLVLGTSLTVYPVAAIPQYFCGLGKPVILINKMPTPYQGVPGCIEIHDSIGASLEKIDELLCGKTI